MANIHNQNFSKKAKLARIEKLTIAKFRSLWPYQKPNRKINNRLAAVAAVQDGGCECYSKYIEESVFYASNGSTGVTLLP